MADSLSSERRSWNMSRIGGRDTKPETQLRSLLHRAGYRFRLHVRDLPGRPDIVLPRYRTAIFVNGCFWHRHDACKNATTPSTRREFWQAKFDENVSRDKRNRLALQHDGWKVIIVWECELERCSEAIVDRISRRLERAR